MNRLLASLLCFLALGVAGCGDNRPSIAAPPEGGDFVLQSADGPVDTRALRGKVLLVYFGYLNCPDICPASMAAGAQALIALTPEERAKTKMIMISVDPERDTPAALKQYAAFFHPDMIGVTGTAAEIETVAKSFGAGYIRRPPDANGRYAVDHSAHTYLIDPDGRLAVTIPLGTPTADIVAAIRKHLP
jgi:protein SCO1/2